MAAGCKGDSQLVVDKMVADRLIGGIPMIDLPEWDVIDSQAFCTLQAEDIDERLNNSKVTVNRSAGRLVFHSRLMRSSVKSTSRLL